jgi:ferrous iron transport protein A
LIVGLIFDNASQLNPMDRPAFLPSPRSKAADDQLFLLSNASTGDAGVIVRVGSAEDPAAGHDRTELERRLLEMGFVEGAQVRVLHQGFIGRDPIAVQLDDMRVALRRREARDIVIRRREGSHG